MTDRFTQRKVSLRRQKWFKILVAVVVVVAVAAGAWLIWFSSILTVKSVKVEGLTTLKSGQVRDAAEVPMGEQVVRVDLDEIASRVNTMPRVREVEVSRSWPQSISIKVTERTAVVWMESEGEIRGVDQFGIEFREYDKEPKGLVEAKVEGFNPDDRLNSLEAIAAVAQELRSKKPAWREELQAITASTKDDVTLDLTDGRSVVWGSADQTERKLEVLQSLLTIKAKGYDVSAPDQPTTKD